MTSVPTVRTAKGPTFGFGGKPVALGAGRRGPPLVDPDNGEPRHRGLVAEGLEEMGATPGVRHPAVLEAAGILRGDALGVAHDEGAHVVALRRGDHGPGRLVVGLANPSAVASLGPALAGSELSPTPRSRLTAPRGFRGHLSLTGLGVGQMEAFLGPDGPSRDEEGLGPAGHGERVDDPGIHPCDGGTRARGHRHLRRDVEDQTSGIAKQGDRADLIGGVREGPGQPQPQLGGPTGHRQSDAAVLELEGPLVVAQRHQMLASPRVAGPLAAAFALGRFHAGIRVAAQDRAQRRNRELAHPTPATSRQSSWKPRRGFAPRRKRNEFSSIRAAQTSPPASRSPKQRRLWAGVRRKAIRAVR